MVESRRYDGSPTHVVSFVWSNGCLEGEEVYLIGDFTGNWKDSIRLAHKGGSRYEAEIRLRHGKYSYKFIVGGQWRHSTSLSTESDQSGNINNVIQVGDTARIRSFGPTQQYMKVGFFFSPVAPSFSNIYDYTLHLFFASNSHSSILKLN